MLEQNQIEEYIKLARNDLDDNKIDSSIDSLIKALELDSDNLEVDYLLGIALIKNEDYDVAISHLTRVTSSEFSYLHTQQALMLLGYIYSKKEMYIEAEEVFNRALYFNFNNEIAYSALGHIYYKLSNIEKSLEMLDKAIEIDPTNFNSRNTKAYVMCESNIDIDEALSESLKAVEAEPNNYLYQDTLGWIYYKMGKEELAREALKNALELSPDNEIIKNHMRQLLEIN